MLKLSEETRKLTIEYRKLYKKKPEPFWFGKSEDEYKKYLKEEIEKFNNTK